jgi:threonine aldolase
VKKICKDHKLRLHLDGARSLNAAHCLKKDPAVLFKDFDTINFCLSKGMGCPIGSLVIGKNEDMVFANIARKLLGGSMRQAGVLAACGLVSLEDWEERFENDHENAKFIGEELKTIKNVEVNVD